MPAYNFKSQFAPLVESGEKRQTIRFPRKRQTKKGEELQLYTGMRTKNCRLLRRESCNDVKPVDIYAWVIHLDGKQLSWKEGNDLARADGFANLTEFFRFFEFQYGLSEKKPLTGMEIICW